MTPEFPTENFSIPTNVSKSDTNVSWPRPPEFCTENFSSSTNVSKSDTNASWPRHLGFAGCRRVVPQRLLALPTAARFVACLLACLSSQQRVSGSQGSICSGSWTCCHTEIEVADQTFYLTRSQYTETEPTSPSADPTTLGALQGSHWSANVSITGMTWPGKNPVGASENRTPYLLRRTL